MMNYQDMLLPQEGQTSHPRKYISSKGQNHPDLDLASLMASYTQVHTDALLNLKQ